MNLPYWDYFLSIESDLEQCGRFVEFSEQNFNTYSIQFARIIMAASSEFDNVAKALCKTISPSESALSINEYYPIIQKKYPKFFECEVHLYRYNLCFKPWEGWTAEGGPEWWSKGYNKIKHNRDDHFSQANLKNAIVSTAGLLVGIVYYYNSSYDECPAIKINLAPRLFDIETHDSCFSWDYHP
jgi:hypothetical protein